MAGCFFATGFLWDCELVNCLADALHLSDITWTVASLLQFGLDSSRIKAAAGSAPLTKDKCHEAGKALGCSV
jgi:hypothetical protein